MGYRGSVFGLAMEPPEPIYGLEHLAHTFEALLTVSIRFTLPPSLDSLVALAHFIAHHVLVNGCVCTP